MKIESQKHILVHEKIRGFELKTEDILNEREKTHGKYSDVAYKFNQLKAFLIDSPEVDLEPKQELAVLMICLKLARIVCGDPTHEDHWDDIAGYAMLGKGNGKKEGKNFFSCRNGLADCECESTISKMEHAPTCDTEEKETVANFFKEAIEKLDSGLNELKNKYDYLFQDTSSYKMEHVPKCDICGNECETTCFTLKDIDLNKRFCPKCIGEIGVG